MSKEKLKEQRDILMEQFDFEQVQNVCKHLGLKIGINKNSVKKLKTPNVEDLKKIANICFDKVIESEEAEFTASLCDFEVEKNGGELEIRFVLQRVNLLGRKFGHNVQNAKTKFPIKNF